jgi:hypothetical protein
MTNYIYMGDYTGLMMKDLKQYQEIREHEGAQRNNVLVSAISGKFEQI